MTTKASHIVRSGNMAHAADAKSVFPLLCPTREYEWIDHWACDLLHSTSGYMERDCVFTTDLETRGPETWLCTRHEPDRLLELVVIGPEVAIRYTIELEEKPGGCASTWTQHLTALSPAGEARVAALTESAYAEFITMIDTRINHFLATGQCYAEEAA